MGKTYVQGEVLNATDLNASFLELKTLPINPQTSTYTLVVDDLGKVISATGSINIPASVFASGSTVSIFNNSSAVINIIQAAGLTLYNASTSVAGSFTLNSRGICSVIFVNTTTAVLTGVGVSVTASGTLQGPVGPAGSFGTISAGSAAAPSIAPAADTNTGMFFPAADTIAFAEGGTEAMRIDSGGNVLVGTTSTLGNALFVSRVGIAARSVAGDNITPYIQSYNGNAGTDLKTWRLGTVAAGDLIFETVNDAYNSSTERMRIDSNGRVNIGTSSSVSGAKLAVVGGPIQLSGSTSAAAGLRVQSLSGVAHLSGINSDNNAFNPIAFYTSSTEALRIATAGQIGIGGANYGTSGQVLTSGGAAAAPSWAAIPSSAPTTAQVLTATAAASYAAVGTYVFGKQFNGAPIGAGGTSAGSDITPSNVAANGGTTLSGTWRCMGLSNNPMSSTSSTTLWLRIS